jgi:hypothetical protein
MPTFPHARNIATLAAAGALALGTALPAGAATAPGSRPDAAAWSVATTIGPAVGDWSEEFSASGADDAWSAWNACATSSCSGTGGTISSVEHWNGSAWAQVPVPASLAKYAASPVAVSSSSASNAWLFNPDNTLRWNGSAWSLHSQPKWVVHFNLSGDIDVAASVFSPTSAWVFSLGIDSTTSPDHYAATWNGKSWSKVTLPGVPDEVSALAPNDIWALGETLATATKNKPTYILMHWNGKSWTTTTLPKVTVPKGAQEYPGSLTADSASEVWLTWNIEQGTAGAQTRYLLKLDQSTWSKVTIKYPTSSVDYTAQDGDGGLWMVANGPAPSYTWYFYHLNGTSWSENSVPAASGMSFQQLVGLTWVPGTQSLWAPADMLDGNDIYGAIEGYGS